MTSLAEPAPVAVSTLPSEPWKREAVRRVLRLLKFDTASDPFRRVRGRRLSYNHPNFNLWNNHGVWFLHCTLYPTANTKVRFRCSLGTRVVEEARLRRDDLLAIIDRLDPFHLNKTTEPAGEHMSAVRVGLWTEL